MNTNLIEVIDNIQMESDNAVLESMFEYYNKAFMIMESCDEEVLDNFNIIQEGFGDDVSKEAKSMGKDQGKVMKVITAIPRLIIAFVKTMISRIQKMFKKSEVVQTAIDKLPPARKRTFFNFVNMDMDTLKKGLLAGAVIGGTAAGIKHKDDIKKGVSNISEKIKNRKNNKDDGDTDAEENGDTTSSEDSSEEKPKKSNTTMPDISDDVQEPDIDAIKNAINCRKNYEDSCMYNKKKLFSFKNDHYVTTSTLHKAIANDVDLVVNCFNDVMNSNTENAIKKIDELKSHADTRFELYNKKHNLINFIEENRFNDLDTSLDLLQKAMKNIQDANVQYTGTPEQYKMITNYSVLGRMITDIFQKSNVLCDEFSTAYAIFFDALEKLSKIPESVSEKVMDMAKNPEKYNAYYEKHPNVAKAIQTLFKDSDNPDKSKPKHKEMN